MSKRGSRRNRGSAKPKPEPAAAATAPAAEVVRTAAARLTPALPASVEAWSPSPYALLDEPSFQSRVDLMRTELRRTEEIKRAILIEDPGDGTGDFGVIPGTQKASLYQPGAEKFNKLAGLQPAYSRECRYGDGDTAPHFSFEVECHLVDEAGRVHGSGGGAANNFEKKFRYRTANLICPRCGVEAVLESRKANEPGFFCWRRRDGCGENFAPDDVRIITQDKGVKENDDPFDLFNTVRQYADKRAYVKATRTTHALSGTFTQDDDDDDPANAGTDPKAQAGKAQDRARKAGRTAATPQQVRAIRDRIREKVTDFPDSGIQPDTIEAGLCGEFGVETLEELVQVDVPNVMKAVFAWEPPGA